MEFTTILVLLMIGWCGYTLWVRADTFLQLRCLRTLHFSIDAEGWLRASRLPEIIGVVGILVAFGHSVLAMSGLETLGAGYRRDRAS